MAEPVYHLFPDDSLTKDNLLQNKSFLNDAANFLIRRENYKAEDFKEDENIYDAYMEHFRAQNVNEITALKDLNYANRADDEEKKRFARLMDTYDRMDSDFGLKAMGDYLGGVFTAPSTYAGMFSFGAAKAGALAANQGVKLGIKQALKTSGLKSALGSFAVESVGAGATAYAQERTRVETGIKTEVDPFAVGLTTLLSGTVGGGLGAVTGTQRALSSNRAQFILKTNKSFKEEMIKTTYKKTTEKVFKDIKTQKTANEFEKILKLSLQETIPDALEEGAEVSKKLVINADQMEIKNIAAFASEIDEAIGDIPNVPKGAERFTSRLVRSLQGLDDTDRILKSDTLQNIQNKYNLEVADLAPLLAHQVSEAASLLGGVSALSRAKYKTLVDGLNTIDEGLRESGLGTATVAARKQLEEQYGKQFMSTFGRGVAHISKARVGLMTIQLATTVRNTTNGYMRNYIYAMDNLGTGVSNLTKAGGKYLLNFSKDATVKEEVDAAVALGVAQLRTSFDSLMLKDLHLGMTNANTQALFRLLADDVPTDIKVGSKVYTKDKKNIGKVLSIEADNATIKIIDNKKGTSVNKTYNLKNLSNVKSGTKRNKDVVATLLRGMGDISNTTGQETGLIAVARTFNTLNTMTDNLFKRAVFAREIDKSIRANPTKYKTKQVAEFDELGNLITKNLEKDITIKNLDDLLKKGRYDLLDPEDVSKAMAEAFEFTYQTGDFVARSGVANSLFKQIINFGSSSLGSTVIPFPRYLVNQFRFWYSHAPVLGTINLGGILNSAGRTAGEKGFVDLSPEAFGRQVGGLSLLGALYALRVNYGDENTGAYEYIDPTTGAAMDAKAMLGPFTPYALLADVFYREFPEIHGNMNVSDVKTYKTRDFTEAGLGGFGRAGTGLAIVDTFVDSFQESDSVKDYNIKKAVTKYLGNVANTFTVGAGVIKDVYQQVYPDFLELPDNSDVDFFKYFLKQATRSFPIAVDEDRPRLESPTRGTGRRAYNPIVKQFTGFTPKERRTVIEDELERLRFDYFETTPKAIKGDAPATNKMRGEMGRYMEDEVFAYIRSNDYQNASTDILKRLKLKTVVDFYRAKAREQATSLEFATDQDFIFRLRRRFQTFGTEKRKVINQLYKEVVKDSDVDFFNGGNEAMKMLPYLENLYNDSKPKLN